MLTKDLLRFNRNRQARLFPRFLNVEDRISQQLVTELAELYATGQGQSREDLAELAQPIINAHRSPLIAKGINKLLLDRCLFQEPDSELESFRAELFTVSAQLLAGDDPRMDNLSHFRDAVGDHYQQPADALAASLYRDLPIRQPLISFEPISPARLLHRYNMAQAQGLLFTCSAMTLTIDEPDIGKRRFFFRYLKFYRLLIRVYQLSRTAYRLELDGPLSLFDQTRKYGLRMASFLPVIALLSNWTLEARVKPEQQSGTLVLNQGDGLVSHYQQITSYIPEEFTIFAQQFAENGNGWKIQGNPPLLDLGRQELAVADFSFRHKSKTVVHLELFHRWHMGPLIQRLKLMEKNPKKIPLAIGVDRHLSKDIKIAGQLEKSPWFQGHGFVFNEFPPVKRVVDCLNGFLQEDS